MILELIDHDEPGFVALLEAENLPTHDLPGDSKCYFGFRDAKGNLVAVGGFEWCGSNAILRSCVVASEQKGQGIGRCLIEAIVGTARQKRIDQLFLLTESAPRFFSKFGFREIDRDKVPVEIAGSEQFSEICPQSAMAMALQLVVSPSRD